MWLRPALGVASVALMLAAAGCGDDEATRSTGSDSPAQQSNITEPDTSTTGSPATTSVASTTTAVIPATTSVASTTTAVIQGAGPRITFSQRGDIYVMNADGTDLTNITNDAARDHDPEWSPLGAYIAFESIRDFPSDGYKEGIPSDIYAIGADGTRLLRLTSGSASSHNPTWSPDGLDLAFVRNGDICVTTSYGGPAYSRTDHPGYDTHPAWSPDGTQIAFASLRGDTYDIYVMNADGSDLTQLTSNLDDNSQPAWSPDGSRIAFAADRGRVNPYLGLEIRTSDVYMMDADGSNIVRVTTDPSDDTSPAWSQDGTQIAFLSNRHSEGGVYNVFVMGADGSNPTNLTQNSYSDGPPSWSPMP